MSLCVVVSTAFCVPSLARALRPPRLPCSTAKRFAVLCHDRAAADDDDGSNDAGDGGAGNDNSAGDGVHAPYTPLAILLPLLPLLLHARRPPFGARRSLQRDIQYYYDFPSHNILTVCRCRAGWMPSQMCIFFYLIPPRRTLRPSIYLFSFPFGS